MTKREAAGHVLFVLKLMRRRVGDADIDEWRLLLAWVAERLDPTLADRIWKELATAPDASVEAKVRALIEHPNTPPDEREAAVRALARIREARDVDD